MRSYSHDGGAVMAAASDSTKDASDKADNTDVADDDVTEAPDVQSPENLAAGQVSTSEAIVTAEEHRTAIEAEYGEWVAIQDIDIDGVPAFRRGDPVPRGHVNSGSVKKESVARRTTKAASSVIDELKA